MGLKLVSQGAEGRLFEGVMFGKPVLVKERFPKKYRHPVLDAKLTRTRLVSETRCLVRCRNAGIHAPCPLYIDKDSATIIMEKLPGVTARAFLNTPALSDRQHECMRLIGSTLARLHNAGMVHGDPTTSNMIVSTPSGDLRAAEPVKLSLIDFGLASVSSSVEDKAVDLYVLERAFVSTHPTLGDQFDVLLDAYFGDVTDSADIRAKFNKVRARGRKRTAFG